MNTSPLVYHYATKATCKIHSLHMYYYKGRGKTVKEREKNRDLQRVTLPASE